MIFHVDLIPSFANVEQSLVLKGQYTITIQKGAIRLLGAVLRASQKKYKVIAGATSSLPVIECALARGKLQERFYKTKQNSHMQPLFTTVILIESLYTGLEDIPVLFPSTYKSLWSFEGAQDAQRTFSAVFTASLSVQVIMPYKSWVATADDVVEHFKRNTSPVVLMAGTKSSGKSTFLKYLSNYLISQCGENTVYYLECDPRHSEYSPPGIVSLHQLKLDFSSAFAHGIMEGNVKAHSIGTINPKQAFLHYISTIQDLIRHYNIIQQKSQTPSTLIINTPGWSKGLGMQLLESIFQVAKPSHFAYMGAELDSETFEDFEQRFSRHFSYAKFWQPTSILSTTQPGVLLPGRGCDRLTSAHVQNLQLMTYFHYSEDTNTFNFKNPITHFKPYAVPYKPAGIPEEVSSNFIQAFGALFAEGVSADDAELCLNGTVVSMVAVDKSVALNTSPGGVVYKATATSDFDDEMELTVEAKVSPLPWLDSKSLTSVLDPKTCRCLGLALIQSFDRASNKVRILTPVDCQSVIQELEETKMNLVFIRGAIRYPSEDMLWNTSSSVENDNKFTLRDPITKKKLYSLIPFFSSKPPVGPEGQIQFLKQSIR